MPVLPHVPPDVSGLSVKVTFQATDTADNAIHSTKRDAIRLALTFDRDN